MRFSIATAPLLDAVGQAAGVAAAKSPKRILECVAIRAKKGEGVSIEANDLDVSIRIQLPDARVEDEGVVVVPAARTTCHRVKTVEPGSQLSDVVAQFPVRLSETFRPFAQAPRPKQGRQRRAQRHAGSDQLEGQQPWYVIERLATVSTA